MSKNRRSGKFRIKRRKCIECRRYFLYNTLDTEKKYQDWLDEAKELKSKGLQHPKYPDWIYFEGHGHYCKLHIESRDNRYFKKRAITCFVTSSKVLARKRAAERATIDEINQDHA